MQNLAVRNEKQSNSDVTSITVRLSGDALSDVRKQAGKLGVSINEYIRRAIGTETFLLSQKDEGSRILIQDKDSSVREVILR